MQAMEMDDSASLRPSSASRRVSEGQRRRQSQHESTAGVGLGLWGVVTWPVTTVFSIFSGAWYFISPFASLRLPQVKASSDDP